MDAIIITRYSTTSDNNFLLPDILHSPNVRDVEAVLGGGPVHHMTAEIQVFSLSKLKFQFPSNSRPKYVYSQYAFSRY